MTPAFRAWDRVAEPDFTRRAQVTVTPRPNHSGDWTDQGKVRSPLPHFPAEREIEARNISFVQGPCPLPRVGGRTGAIVTFNEHLLSTLPVLAHLTLPSVLGVILPFHVRKMPRGFRACPAHTASQWGKADNRTQDGRLPVQGPAHCTTQPPPAGPQPSQPPSAWKPEKTIRLQSTEMLVSILELGYLLHPPFRPPFPLGLQEGVSRGVGR